MDRLSGVVAQAATALQTARLVDKVTYQARHDGLTGLANRAAFTERMKRELVSAEERDQPLGLFFVDLDDFKSVNDEHGHHAGDQLLSLIAERMRGSVRACDTVARLGGDEFAVVLPGASRLDAERVTRRLREATAACAAEPVKAIEASFGIAVYERGEVPDRLMARADEALYRDKRGSEPGARLTG
jgi:diguanylate cyclase (GGDEF)-like protein